MNRFISFPCIVDKIESKKDRTLKVVLGLPELPPSESSILLSLANKEAVGYLSPNALQEAELTVVDKDMPKGKTPSQRFRSVLFILWKQLGSKDTFAQYYATHYERLIEQIKEKLDNT